MKKELFNRIVEYVSTIKPVHKHTVKESFDSYCYLIHDGSADIAKLKAMLANSTPPSFIAQQISRALTTYITVTYDETKDKISIGEFEVGWLYAGKKDRWYPTKKNKPILCYSKMIYNFHFRNRKPRVMNTGAPSMWSAPYQKIMMMMMGIDYMPTIMAPARHAFGTKDDWEIIYNVTGIKAPKALKVFLPSEVYELIRVLRNPNELSSVCMELAKETPNSENQFGFSRPEIYSTLSKMMLRNTSDSWLIRDYIKDHVTLKRKMSLKITSKTRIEDEHRKMTKEILIRGIKEIKVDECYVEMFKTFPIEGAELIQDKTRLLQESIDQNHCVATYGSSINAGSCCIISVPYNGRQWTLQVSRSTAKHTDGKYTFAPVQCKGLRNEQAPKELNDLIKAHFTGVKVEDFINVPAHIFADDLPF